MGPRCKQKLLLGEDRPGEPLGWLPFYSIYARPKVMAPISFSHRLRSPLLGLHGVPEWVLILFAPLVLTMSDWARPARRPRHRIRLMLCMRLLTITWT